MHRRLVIRALQGLIFTLVALAGLAAILLAVIDTGIFRRPLVHFIATRSGREIQVAGPLGFHVFSHSPRITAEGVQIGNPPWTSPGATAQIDKLTVFLRIPGPGHWFGIDGIDMKGAALTLARDESGRANWQWSDPSAHARSGLPLIRSLSMPNARVTLDDARRHLRFEGTVSVLQIHPEQVLKPLRIEGSGQLNGRPATFQINGAPLISAQRGRPYRFDLVEDSSGSRLTGQGFLPKPFDMNEVDTMFTAMGPNLKDLYFLTGITLVNTGSYRLAGAFVRQDRISKFSNLVVTSGESDVHGTVTVTSSNGRANLDIDFTSERLRLADLGARAAGIAQSGPAWLISDAALKPSSARRSDAQVHYRASRVDVGRTMLQNVKGQLTIDHGHLILAPLTAQLLGGRLDVRAKLDATTDQPAADLDVELKGIELAQLFVRAGAESPIDGVMQARVAVTGRGSSLHQIAATANGRVTAVLPRGAIKASLAELAGVDLRGVGLLVGSPDKETGVRCGVASFRAQDGLLTAQTLLVDTDPLLITGDGQIHLDTEQIELTMHGRPKAPRLRLRSPLLVNGTLAHPKLGLKPGGSVAQGAAAIALGALLTPLGAALAFVDPGLAKDANCDAEILKTRIP